MPKPIRCFGCSRLIPDEGAIHVDGSELCRDCAAFYEEHLAKLEPEPVLKAAKK